MAERVLHPLPPVASLLLALAAACGGGGGGGGGGAPGASVEEEEPNDTAAAAGSLALGGFGHGTVADASDSDFWKVTLGAGQVVAIEVFANRHDQAGWGSGPNAAEVTLLDTDGVTELLRQGDGEFGWNPEQDTDIHAFLAPAAGTYFLRVDVDDVFSTGGEYLIAVSPASLAAPIQSELEPAGVSGLNDGNLTAESILPGTVAGFFVDDETDWYSFALSEASFVTFTMHAHRSGVWRGDDSHYDPRIRLYDSALALLADNDDSYYLDSAIHHLLMVPDTYFLEVGEVFFSGDSGYQLEFTSTPLVGPDFVGEVEPNDSAPTAQAVAFGALVMGGASPGDDDYFLLACNAGDRIQVEVFDAGNLWGALADVALSIENGAGVLPHDGDGGLSLHRTILTSSGSYYVHVSSGGTTTYALRATRIPNGFESEPNDAVADAGAFDANGRAAGVIGTPGDLDLFAFQATRGVPVVLSCLADDVGPSGFPGLDGFGSELDPILTVADASGTVLASADATLGTAVGVLDGLATVTLAFLPPATGTFYAGVADASGGSGSNFTYVLLQR